MLPTENTVTGWSAVIADLRTKRKEATENTDKLRAEKKQLALQAAMDENSAAKKRLDKINAELTKASFEVDDFDSAIAQAEQSKKQAEAAERDAAEKERQAELSRLTATAIAQAGDYTEALQRAVEAGRSARATLRQMLKVAHPNENANIQRLLDTAPFMRCGEFLGLRETIEFQMYKGPRQHLSPLEMEFAALLARWNTAHGEREDAKTDREMNNNNG